MDKEKVMLTEDEKKIFRGGESCLMIFLKDNEPTDEENADSARFLVFDKDDHIIYESYGSLEKHLS